MKEIFNGFYTPSDKSIKKCWSDKKTLFIFDTNVLLNLYSYTAETRDDFFHIIEKISSKIWLPYHVGLEYQRNRLSIIKNEKKIFNDINIYLENIENNLETNKLQELKLKQRLPELQKKTEELHSAIRHLITKHKEHVEVWNKKQPDVRSSDEIRKKIDNLFKGKIGLKPENQEWLKKLYDEGIQRYKNLTPPGYKDMKDKENKDKFSYSGLEYIPMYGDLIIWKQIIDKASHDEISSLIFITDDVKEDWWYILDSNGKKEIGARAELRDEIHRHSQISNFQILRTTDFMKYANDLNEHSVKETSIQETESKFENKRKAYNIKNDQDISNKLIEIDEEFKKKYVDYTNQYIDKYDHKILYHSDWERPYDEILRKNLSTHTVTKAKSYREDMLEKIKKLDIDENDDNFIEFMNKIRKLKDKNIDD